MTVRRLLCCGVLTLSLVGPGLVQAQGVPVYDNANFIQNVITAVQTVEMVANQLLELIGLDEIVLGEGMIEEMGQLQEIMAEANGLGMDIANIQLQLKFLFDLDTAPKGSQALRERMALIRRYVWKVYVDALRAQSLMQSTVSALRHMVRLTEAIGDFLGNNQGNQTLAQWDIKLSVELIKLKTQTAAFYRAQAFEHLSEPLTVESLHNINNAVMADHPE